MTWTWTTGGVERVVSVNPNILFCLEMFGASFSPEIFSGHEFLVTQGDTAIWQIVPSIFRRRHDIL